MEFAAPTTIQISLPAEQLQLLEVVAKELNKANPKREWLNMEEVCNHFGVKESTIYKWMKEYQLPYSGISEVKRFHIEKINKWFLKFSSDDFAEGMKIISKRKAA